MAYGAILGQTLNAYTKNETFSSTSQSLYGVQTPDAAFQAIPELIEPIGTIKTTVRTDLGDNWLLCNGEQFSQTTYPELYNVMPEVNPSNIYQWIGNNITNINNNNNLSKIVYNNNIYATASTNYKNLLFYSSNLNNGIWNNNSPTNNNFQIFNIKFINGYWVALGNMAYSSNGTIFYYSSDITSSSWTQVLFNSSSTNCFTYDIVYNNGYYVMCGYQPGDNANTSMLWYATNIEGPWTTATIQDQQFLSLQKIYYQNGYYVTCGPRKNNTKGYFYYTTDPTASWQSQSAQPSSLNNIYVGIQDIQFINNQWIGVGWSTFNSMVDYGYIFVASSIGGPWTTAYISSEANYHFDSIAFNNNHCIVSYPSYSGITNGGIVYSSNNGSTWALIENFSSIFGKNNNNFNNVNYINNYFTGTGTNIIYINMKNILPSITTPGAYNYIKAQEGF